MVDRHLMRPHADGVHGAYTDTGATYLAQGGVADNHDSYLNDWASMKWELARAFSRQLLVTSLVITVG